MSVDEFDKRAMTLVGHSGCNCWAFIIDELGQMVFTQRCTGNDFKTGFYISLNKVQAFVVVYSQDKREI